MAGGCSARLESLRPRLGELFCVCGGVALCSERLLDLTVCELVDVSLSVGIWFDRMCFSSDGFHPFLAQCDSVLEA